MNPRLTTRGRRKQLRSSYQDIRIDLAANWGGRQSRAAIKTDKCSLERIITVTLIICGSNLDWSLGFFKFFTHTDTEPVSHEGSRAFALD